MKAGQESTESGLPNNTNNSNNSTTPNRDGPHIAIKTPPAPPAPARQDQSTVVNPEDFDILLGRGRTSWGHVGNKRFRSFVGVHLKQYQGTNSRTEKSKTVDAIYDDIMKVGGRFLRQDTATGLWHPVERKMAREKIAHALRDAVNQRIKTNDTTVTGDSILARKEQKEREESSVATGTSVDSASTAADNYGDGGGTPKPDPKGNKEEPGKLAAAAKLADEPSQESNNSSMVSGDNTKQGSALKKGIIRGSNSNNSNSSMAPPASFMGRNGTSAAAVASGLSASIGTISTAGFSGSVKTDEMLAHVVTQTLTEVKGDLAKSVASGSINSKVRKIKESWLDDDISTGFSAMSIDSSKKSAQGSHFSAHSKMFVDEFDVSGEFGIDPLLGIPSKHSLAGSSLSGGSSVRRNMRHQQQLLQQQQQQGQPSDAQQQQLLQQQQQAIFLQQPANMMYGSVLHHAGQSAAMGSANGTAQAPSLQECGTNEEFGFGSTLASLDDDDLTKSYADQTTSSGVSTQPSDILSLTDDFSMPTITGSSDVTPLTITSSNTGMSSRMSSSVGSNSLGLRRFAESGTVGTGAVGASENVLVSSSNNNNNNSNNNNGNGNDASEEQSVRTTETEREFRDTIRALAAV